MSRKTHQARYLLLKQKKNALPGKIKTHASVLRKSIFARQAYYLLVGERQGSNLTLTRADTG
jgi:hypothetical protein